MIRLPNIRRDPYVGFIYKKDKPSVIFAFALCALGLLIASTVFSVLIFRQWQGLACGCGLMLLAIPFHWCGKKHPWCYCVSFFMNSVANGFSLSTLFLLKKVTPELIPMLLSAIPPAVILLLTYLMLQIWHKTKKVTLNAAVAINLLALIVTGWVWFVGGDFFVFFMLLISLFYLCVFGISINREDRSVLRDISFGSFGSFIILTVVVLTVLTDGEAFGIIDFDLDIGSREKKKR